MVRWRSILPFNPILRPSWTVHSFIFIFILALSMDISAIDLTEEVQTCYHCKKKQAEDITADHVLWRNALSRVTGQSHLICSSCVIHYSEKSHCEGSSLYQQFCTHSDMLAGTSTSRAQSSPSSSHVTSQRVPIQKLVANSQQGIGACSAK